MSPVLLVPPTAPFRPPASLLSFLPIGALARGLLSVFTTWIVEGTAHFVSLLGGSLAAVSTPQFGPGFLASFHEVVVLGAAVALPLLLLAVVHAVVRQDLGLLVRTALVKLPVALVLGAAGAQLVGALCGVTDELCNALVAHGGPSLRALVSGLAGALTGSAARAPGPGFAEVVLALLTMVVSLVLWVELVVRSAAIQVAALFLPLALSGLVWSPTALWARRLAETLVALIVAKLVIVGVLVLAASTAVQGTGLSAIGWGLAFLLLAVWAPFAVLRLVPLVDAGAIGHLEGLGRRAVGGVAGRSLQGAGHLSDGGAGEDVVAMAEPQRVGTRELRAAVAQMAAEERAARESSGE